MINRFAEFIARRKAWQVFLVLVGLTLACQVVLTSKIPTSSQLDHPPDMQAVNQFAQASMLATALMLLCVLSWLLSIGWVANQRIRIELRPSARWFFSAPVYATTYLVFASHVLPSSVKAGHGLLPLVVAMHLLAMVAIFYVLGFTARNLILAERQSPVSFFDYSGPFFLLWFFPIGVWFVQPRVNRLVGTTQAPLP